jgi:hypothetical protein
MKIGAALPGIADGLTPLRQALSSPRVSGIASLLNVDLGNEVIRNAVLDRAEVNLRIASIASADSSALPTGGQYEHTRSYIDKAINAYREMQLLED